MAARTAASCRTVPMRERMSRCPRIVGVTMRNSECTGRRPAPIEVDRMLEREEGDLRLRHAKHDRIAHVGDREALRDADRAQPRASQQHLEDHAPVGVRGKRQSLHRGGHDRAPVVPAQPAHDAPGAHRPGQGSRRRAPHGAPEEVARDGPPELRRPFVDRLRMEAELTVHLGGRQPLALHPSKDRVLRDAHVGRHFPHPELHRPRSSRRRAFSID